MRLGPAGALDLLLTSSGPRPGSLPRGVAASLIAAIAWSRVWLGVHWTSDVVGSLAIAFVTLSAAEAAIERRHRPP